MEFNSTNKQIAEKKKAKQVRLAAAAATAVAPHRSSPAAAGL